MVVKKVWKGETAPLCPFFFFLPFLWKYTAKTCTKNFSIVMRMESAMTHVKRDWITINGYDHQAALKSFTTSIEEKVMRFKTHH